MPLYGYVKKLAMEMKWHLENKEIKHYVVQIHRLHIDTHPIYSKLLSFEHTKKGKAEFKIDFQFVTN